MIERSEQGADPGVRRVPAPAATVVPTDPTDPTGTSPWSAFGGDTTLGAELAAGDAPANRSAGWAWLLFAAIGFVGGQVVAAIFASITAAISGNTASLTAIAKLDEPPTWYVVSTLVGLWAGFFGSAWLAAGVRGTRSFRRDLGLRFRWIDLLGVVIGVGGQFLVALMYVPISHHVHDFNQRFDAPSQRLTGGSHGPSFALIALLTIVGAPFFEELFFRGVLLRSLTRLFWGLGRRVGPPLAVVLTGLLFGLAHAESLQLLGLATFGAVLSVVSYRTGRLGMNMVAHASFNAVAVAAAIIGPLGVLHGTVL